MNTCDSDANDWGQFVCIDETFEENAQWAYQYHTVPTLIGEGDGIGYDNQFQSNPCMFIFNIVNATRDTLCKIASATLVAPFLKMLSR